MWLPAQAIAAAVTSGATAASGAAIEQALPAWTVLHCGFAEGVLYLTYAVNGKAAITPAVDNAANRASCDRAGYPLAGAVPGRIRQQPQRVPEQVVSGAPQPQLRMEQPQPPQPAPVFTPLAVGSALAIDARNDGDAAQACLISFSYSWDDNVAGPRSSTAQAILPAGQRNRVVSVNTPGSGARFVTPPTTSCRPLN